MVSEANRRLTSSAPAFPSERVSPGAEASSWSRAASSRVAPDGRQVAGHPLADDRCRATGVRGHDGALARQGLDRDDRGSLVLRGEEKGIEGSVPAAHVAAVAQEAAAPSNAQLCRQGFDAHPLGPVTDDDQISLGSLGPELCERADEVVGALDRRQPPGPADDECLGRELDLTATTGPLGLVGPGQPGEVEPVRDHDDLVGRRGAAA